MIVTNKKAETFQRIESGKRFVTDIELKVIADVLKINYQDLLD